MPPEPVNIMPANLQVAEQDKYLGVRRQAELDAFLPKIQANPYDPDIIKNCELLPNDRYRYVLPSGCEVTWQLETQPAGGKRGSAGEAVLILLLDVEY